MVGTTLVFGWTLACGGGSVGGTAGAGGDGGGPDGSGGVASGGTGATASGGGEACTTGSVLCSCFANDTCNDGLICASGVCVDPQGSCTEGDEGCTCYANDTCNGDLSCASGYCVNLGGATGGAGGIANLGGAPTTGGTPPSTGGTPPATGGTPPATGGTPPADLNLIDDFADCDRYIIEAHGRKGEWYSFPDATGIDAPVFGPPPSSSWGDQSCGAFLTGYCPTCEGVGLGFHLAPGVYDLSGWSGLKVTFESEGSLFVAVKTTDGQNYGYAYGEIVGTGSYSGTRTLYFSQMAPDTYYHGLTRATEIQFTVDDYGKTYGFGFGIHRVELF
jgi:hypothetical protein